jgi:hypothetical protein
VSNICPSSILACGLRVTKLDAVGNVASGANNYYVADDLIQITFTPELAQGSDRELRSGCDCVIASAKFPDLLKRFTLEIQKGELTPALESMMLGSDNVLDGSDIIGEMWPDNSACGDTPPPRVAIEVWSEAYEGNGQSQTKPFIHWIFPMSRWSLGQSVLSSDFKTTVLTGYSEPNGLWGHGPYGDGILVGAQGGYWFEDTGAPAAVCGYQTITPSS